MMMTMMMSLLSSSFGCHRRHPFGARMPVISRRLIVGRIVEDGRGQVQDRLLHDSRDKAVVVVVYRWGCQPQDRRARCNDGGRIPHVQRRAVLEDNFQRPPPPSPWQQGAIPVPPPQGGIKERQSAEAVGDNVLQACERRLLDVNRPWVKEFDVACRRVRCCFCCCCHLVVAKDEDVHPTVHPFGAITGHLVPHEERVVGVDKCSLRYREKYRRVDDNRLTARAAPTAAAAAAAAIIVAPPPPDGRSRNRRTLWR